MSRSSILLRCAGTLLLWTRLVASAGAEPADTTSKPLPHLVITEVGFGIAVQGGKPNSSNVCGDVALGYLGRTGRRTMVGGEVGVLAREQVTTVALRPRVRRDLGGIWSANLAAGPIVAGALDGHDGGVRGLSLATGVDLRGYGGVRLELQHLDYDSPYGPKRSETTTTLSMRVGRTPGALTMLVTGIVGAIAAASLDDMPGL